MRVIICDDDEGCCSQLEKWLQAYREREMADVEIEVYNSVEALEDHLAQGEWIDMIFLDIELPEKNGVDFGKELRELRDNDTLSIVYISGKTEYCMDLFELEPMNFHVKPLLEADIVRDMNKALRRYRNGRKVIEYKEDGVSKGILVKDILYIESVMKKTEIVAKNGKRISIRERLNSLADDLVEMDFCRCHRSYLINISYVKRFLGGIITMKNEDSIPVGGKYATLVKNSIRNYLYMEE